MQALEQKIVALDIGGSHATAAVVDLKLRCIDDGSLVRRSVSKDASACDLIEAWVEVIRTATHQRGGAAEVLGIAIPGPFDYVRGVSLLEHKFHSLYGRDIREMLSKKLPGTKIVFGNDAALFGLGEQWAGVATGLRRVIGVTLGTGLGAGLIEDGRVVVDGDPVTDETLWQRPYSGRIAEDFASSRGIEKIYLDIADRCLEAREIARLAVEGDEKAILAWEEFGYHLGQILLPSVQNLRPEAVVLGGNVSLSASLFVPAMGLHTPVLVSKLFDQAALLGAAALAVRA